jgi:hypothetical protein
MNKLKRSKRQTKRSKRQTKRSNRRSNRSKRSKRSNRQTKRSNRQTKRSNRRSKRSKRIDGVCDKCRNSKNSDICEICEKTDSEEFVDIDFKKDIIDIYIDDIKKKQIIIDPSQCFIIWKLLEPLKEKGFTEFKPLEETIVSEFIDSEFCLINETEEPKEIETIENSFMGKKNVINDRQICIINFNVFHHGNKLKIIKDDKTFSEYYITIPLFVKNELNGNRISHSILCVINKIDNTIIFYDSLIEIKIIHLLNSLSDSIEEVQKLFKGIFVGYSIEYKNLNHQIPAMLIDKNCAEYTFIYIIALLYTDVKLEELEFIINTNNSTIVRDVIKGCNICD